MNAYINIRVDDPVGKLLNDFLANIANVFENSNVGINLQVVLGLFIHPLENLLRNSQRDFIGVDRIRDERRNLVQEVQRRVFFW